MAQHRGESCGLTMDVTLEYKFNKEGNAIRRLSLSVTGQEVYIYPEVLQVNG